MAGIDLEILETNLEFAEDFGFEEMSLDFAEDKLPPSEGDWEDAFDSLPDGERAPFQQKTFTLHDTQVEQVDEALRVAKAQGEFTDSPNENSNGNALARIVETYLTEYGQS